MYRWALCATLLVAAMGDFAKAEPVFQGDLAGHLSGQVYSGFPVDSLGTETEGITSLGARTRVRLEVGTDGSFDAVRLRFRLGGDLGWGTWLGRPALEGDELPGSEYAPGTLTEAFVQIEAHPWLGLKAGLMLSQWGLGLVANAGDDLFNGRVQERLFETDRPGDRVLRAALFTKPFASLDESALRGLVLAAAFDRVEKDDTADIGQGDETYQMLGSARFFLSKHEWLGLYYVHRDQTTASGKQLRAHVVDLAGDLEFSLAKAHTLRLQFELAGIFGETELAPSPEHPVHDIYQYGGLVRLQWRTTQWPVWTELDLGLFSGDSNLDDGRLTRFVGDRNLQQGMILFPTIVAWHTGRQRISADRPEVMGYPPEDLDRLASDGGVTAAATLYPKAVWSPTEWLDVYAGLLIALATEHLPDPYTSRTQGGGAPRNAMGQAPTSPLLGFEVDLGVRAKLELPDINLGVVLSAEYGTFIPGGALEGMEPVHATQLTLALRSGLTVETSPQEASE